MLTISKSEAEVIRKKHPEVTIIRTMKQRSGRTGSYFCDETAAAIETLRELRGADPLDGTVS